MGYRILLTDDNCFVVKIKGLYFIPREQDQLTLIHPNSEIAAIASLRFSLFYAQDFLDISGLVLMLCLHEMEGMKFEQIPINKRTDVYSKKSS